MRGIPTLIATSLLAVVGASVVAVNVGSAQAPGERTLTLVERTVPRADVIADVPPLIEGSLRRPGRRLPR